MIWPEYPGRSHPVTLRYAWHALQDIEIYKSLFVVTFLIVAYLLGTHISIPFIHIGMLEKGLASSTLLSAFNELFTGGALGRGAPFALGIVPLFFLYGGITNIPVRKHAPIFIRLTLWSTCALLLLTAVVIGWWVIIGVIANNIISIIGTFLSLLASAVLLYFLENTLTRYGGPNIICINAIVVAVGYLHKLMPPHSLIDYVVLCATALFILTLVMLQKRAVHIPLLNIAEAKSSSKEEEIKGTLSLPATTAPFQSGLLLNTFICIALVVTVLNTITTLRLSPFGFSPLEEALLVVIQGSLFLFFASNVVMDSLLSHFSGLATARKLMMSFWIIPQIQVGTATAHYLTEQAMKNHRLTYALFLVASLLFSLIELGALLFHLPIMHLPFGPLGFIIIITLCTQVGYAAGETIYRFFQGIKTGKFWIFLRPTPADLQPFLEAFSLDEGLLHFFPHATHEERDLVVRLITSLRLGKLIPGEFRAFLVMLQRHVGRQPEQQVEEMPVPILPTLILCTVFSLLMTLLLEWIGPLVVPQIFNNPIVKDGLVFFIATFLACIPFVGLDQRIRGLLRQQSRTSRVVLPTNVDVSRQLDILHFIFESNEIINARNRIIEAQRRDILAKADIHERILEMIRSEVNMIVDDAIVPGTEVITKEQLEKLFQVLEVWVHVPKEVLQQDLNALHREALKRDLAKLIIDHYEQRGKELRQQAQQQGTTFDPLQEFEYVYGLQVIDHLWPTYIDNLHALRDDIASGQIFPQEQLSEFRKNAEALFEDLQLKIRHYLLDALLKLVRNELTLTLQKSLPPHPIKQDMPPAIEEDEEKADSSE